MKQRKRKITSYTPAAVDSGRWLWTTAADLHLSANKACLDPSSPSLFRFARQPPSPSPRRRRHSRLPTVFVVPPATSCLVVRPPSLYLSLSVTGDVAIPPAAVFLRSVCSRRPFLFPFFLRTVHQQQHDDPSHRRRRPATGRLVRAATSSAFAGPFHLHRIFPLLTAFSLSLRVTAAVVVLFLFASSPFFLHSLALFSPIFVSFFRSTVAHQRHQSDRRDHRRVYHHERRREIPPIVSPSPSSFAVSAPLLPLFLRSRYSSLPTVIFANSLSLTILLDDAVGEGSG